MTHRKIAVLICKLDASGTDAANPIVTIAGYVGILSGWLDFEVRARAVLDQFGVKLLHAKEFYDTDGDFRGWTRDKKEHFARQLQECIVGRLELGITTSLVKAEFLKMKRERNVGHNESPMGFCLRHSMARLLGDVIMQEAFAKGYDLTIVHEDGDANAGDAQRIFNLLKALSPWHNKVLLSFGFADKGSSVGLQIGDFLAVTSRKYVGKHSATDGYPEQPTILSILRDGIFLIDDVVTGWLSESQAQSS
jgi:hypothetical protein